MRSIVTTKSERRPRIIWPTLYIRSVSIGNVVDDLEWLLKVISTTTNTLTFTSECKTRRRFNRQCIKCNYNLF